MMPNSDDICIRKCQEAVNALRGCLDKRDGQSHRMALTQGTTGVDCMPTIASWKVRSLNRSWRTRDGRGGRGC